MAQQGDKISEMPELGQVSGNEYAVVVDGKENKKVRLDKLKGKDGAPGGTLPGQVQVVTDINAQCTNQQVPGALAVHEKLVTLEEATENIDGQNKETLYVVDSQNRIIAKIDALGVHSVDFKIPEGSLKDIAQRTTDLLQNYKDRLFLTDSQGRVIMKIDSDGIHTTRLHEKIFSGKIVNRLYNKEFATVGDSLFDGSVFGKILAELSGGIFREDLNNAGYSAGGTTTLSEFDSCGQARMKKLLEDDIVHPSFIFYENVNDGDHKIGTIEDESFFRSNVIKLSSPFSNIAAAKNHWTTNFSSIVAAQSPKTGTMLGIPFSVSNSILITIDTPPTKDGQIIIKIANLGNYGVAVFKDDTIDNVIARILEYSYPNIIDTKVSANTVRFDFKPAKDPNDDLKVDVTINTGSTGVTYHATKNQQGVMYYWKYFYGHDISKWNTQESWLDEISCFSAWKGLIEFTAKNFPKAFLYLVFPKCLNYKWNDPQYKRPDGSEDWDKILKNHEYGKYLFSKQQELCDFYGIPYLDLRNESCITIGNKEYYLANEDVHPKMAGRERWAIAANKLLN